MSVSTEFSETYDRLLELEDSLEVFDIHVDGLPVWERFRPGIWRQILVEGGLLKPIVRGEQPSRYRTCFEDILTKTTRRNPFLVGSHDVAVFDSARQRLFEDGEWMSKYCDPIYEELDLDYVHYDWNPTPNRPEMTERNRYIDLVDCLCRFRRKLGAVSVSIDDGTSERLQRVEQRFDSEFGIESRLAERTPPEFELRAALRGLYEFILKRIDPVVVILVTGWSKPTLIETCRILDIPVVELQHGTINPYNVEYSHPGERSKTLFADYLFTWGEFWNEQTEFPISDNRVYSVGYPYFERERTQYIDVESSNQLLVVSQPIYGDVIAQVATDLSAADPSYDIVYKLHPAEYDGWKDRNPELERSEITVIDSDDPPLYQLFAESRAQLGVASTALFEGLGFGLETYLLEQPGVEYMNGLLERNVGTLVHDHTDLPSTLDTTGDLPKSVVEDIFRPDPIDRIDAALDDITDGQV